MTPLACSSIWVAVTNALGVIIAVGLVAALIAGAVWLLFVLLDLCGD